MNMNDTMSQVEINKAIIQQYFEAYNNKNEAIFDEIISPDYVDHGKTAYMALLEEEMLEQRMTLIKSDRPLVPGSERTR